MTGGGSEAVRTGGAAGLGRSFAAGQPQRIGKWWLTWRVGSRISGTRMAGWGHQEAEGRRGGRTETARASGAAEAGREGASAWGSLTGVRNGSTNERSEEMKSSFRARFRAVVVPVPWDDEEPGGCLAGSATAEKAPPRNRSAVRRENREAAMRLE